MLQTLVESLPRRSEIIKTGPNWCQCPWFWNRAIYGYILLYTDVQAVLIVACSNRKYINKLIWHQHFDGKKYSFQRLQWPLVANPLKSVTWTNIILYLLLFLELLLHVTVFVYIFQDRSNELFGHAKILNDWCCTLDKHITLLWWVIINQRSWP